MIGVAGVATSDTAIVVYVEGSVALDHGGPVLEIGDRIPTDAVLILATDSLIEIDLPDGRLVLSQPGRYELASLSARAGNPATRAAAGAVRRLVRSLGRNPVQARPAVAAGVRGNEVLGPATTDPVWVAGDIADELIEEALAYLDDGLYDLALETLTDAREFGAAEPTVNFYRAIVYQQAGDLRRALSVLTEAEPPARDPLWEAHTLLRAELFYDLSMHPAVHGLIEPLLEEAGTLSDDARSSAMLLLALSYDAYERPRKAAHYLDLLEREVAAGNDELIELIAGLRAAW
ncbi:MAG: hypothetical protein EA383_02065 [Spirochaetaceae bacterium]|nr:MAG: hypothetical protein EA383_02065 [Spirochaetaceae bacterium]